jgi:hypothetical protein
MAKYISKDIKAVKKVIKKLANKMNINKVIKK